MLRVDWYELEKSRVRASRMTSKYERIESETRPNERTTSEKGTSWINKMGGMMKANMAVSGKKDD